MDGVESNKEFDNCDSDTDQAMGKNRGLTPFAAFANGCLYPIFAAFHAYCLNRRFDNYVGEDKPVFDGPDLLRTVAQRGDQVFRVEVEIN